MAMSLRAAVTSESARNGENRSSTSTNHAQHWATAASASSTRPSIPRRSSVIAVPQMNSTCTRRSAWTAVPET